MPEHDLLIFLYTWVGHDNRAGHLFMVAGDDDERLAVSAGDGEDVGDADFDDWRAGGLTVRHTDPLQGAELGFSGDGVSFQGTFEAMHRPFSYLHDSIDGCPAFIADDRFEQSCRVVGTLRLGDRVVEVDGTGQRDHSWGTRDWDSIQDWKWLHLHNQDGDAVHVMLMHARGETTRHGYVVRGGELFSMVDARVRASYDGNFWQTGAELSVVDSAGVETEATVERRAIFRFEAGERMVLHESACAATIGGAPAAAHFEAGWNRDYVALQAARGAS